MKREREKEDVCSSDLRRRRNIKIRIGGISHEDLFKPILKKFKGEPEDLFNIHKWKKWIRREAKRRNAADRFRKDSECEQFAKALMTQLFHDEIKRAKYVGEVVRELGDERAARFNKLLEDYENREIADLADEANGGYGTSCCSYANPRGSCQNVVINDDDSDDDDDEEEEVDDDEEEDVFKSSPVFKKREKNVSCTSSSSMGRPPKPKQYKISLASATKEKANINGTEARKERVLTNTAPANNYKRVRDYNKCPWEEDQDQDKENFPVTEDEIIVKYPNPPSAPPLTLDMFEAIKAAMQKPAKEKVVSGFALNILQQDLAILNDSTEWLVDLNIDFYLELIRERSKEPGYPSVYVFRSYFFTLLNDKDAGYGAVEEATGDDDIFKFDLVFIPVNLSQHWVLVVFEFAKKSLKCYDSMRHSNEEILKVIVRFLKCEYHRKFSDKNESKCDRNGTMYVIPTVDKVVENEGCKANDGDRVFYEDSKLVKGSMESGSMGEMEMSQNLPRLTFDPEDGWDTCNVSYEDIPQQKNAIDCGIFCLQYAEYLSRRKSFDFDQSHIPYFRKRMMYETLTKKLLTTIDTQPST